MCQKCQNVSFSIKVVWTEKLLVVTFNLATPGHKNPTGTSGLWHFELNLHDCEPQTDLKLRTTFPKIQYGCATAVFLRSHWKQHVQFSALLKAYWLTCYSFVTTFSKITHSTSKISQELLRRIMSKCST